MRTIVSYTAVSPFCFYWPVTPPNIHSFPTRRSSDLRLDRHAAHQQRARGRRGRAARSAGIGALEADRQSTRLNSSHLGISYAVFCLEKKRGSAAPKVIAGTVLGNAPSFPVSPGPVSG